MSRVQLLAAGVSGSAIGRALRVRRAASRPPRRVRDGCAGTAHRGWATLAALLAAGDGALLSHATAAWRWRIIPAPPSVMQLAVPRPTHGTDGGGDAARQSRRLRADDVTTNAGFPTTTVARTLLDLAARYTQRALGRALAEAEFQHDLRPADIQRTLRRGHPGSANLRAALRSPRPRSRRDEERAGAALPPAADRAAGSSCRCATRQLGPWTVDCLWPDRRVAVELDGRQHERPHQADSDDDRDLWLRRHGYVTRRYGKRQLDRAPRRRHRRPPRRARLATARSGHRRRVLPARAQRVGEAHARQRVPVKSNSVRLSFGVPAPGCQPTPGIHSGCQ